jgi:hypothetical protein
MQCSVAVGYHIFGGPCCLHLHGPSKCWYPTATPYGVTNQKTSTFKSNNTGVYPKVSGLAAWSENWKWYSSLPLGTVISLFCESVSQSSEFSCHNLLCCFSKSVCCCLFRYRLSPEIFGYTLVFGSGNWHIFRSICYHSTVCDNETYQVRAMFTWR